jgi:hypothetical protein
MPLEHDPESGCRFSETIMLERVAMARRGTAMNNSRNRKPAVGRFRSHVIATSLAAMLVLAGGVGHALAQEDDDDELPDTKFFKSMLQGLGLKKDGMQSNGINYQERPPLVVPPTRDLPPPQTTDAVRGNAAWPKDQDEQRRRQAAVKRKKEDKPFEWSDLGAQLSPNELKKGATTAKDQALKQKSPQEFEQYNRQYKPDELGYTGGLFGSVKDFFGVSGGGQTATFEAEPPRASLTDPPIGYRSPSPAQPYGVTKDTSRTKAMAAEDRPSSGTDMPSSK